MQPYRSKEWREFRANVILLDKYQCIRCGRSEAHGVTLHVHHKIYRKGCLPWEYALDECETLCAGCHAEHHGKIPPKVGWEFAGYDDLGELIGTCDLCGTDIRHVFLVYHSNWPTMEVGEICCDHLTCTELASNHTRHVADGFELRMNGRKGKRIYSSVVSAKARAFDVLESAEYSDFVARIRRLHTPAHILLGRA